MLAPLSEASGRTVRMSALAAHAEARCRGCPASLSSPVTVPQLWWLSIAQSDLGTVLDSIEDFYPLVQYKVSYIRQIGVRFGDQDGNDDARFEWFQTRWCWPYSSGC